MHCSVHKLLLIATYKSFSHQSSFYQFDFFAKKSNLIEALHIIPQKLKTIFIGAILVFPFARNF